MYDKEEEQNPTMRDRLLRLCQKMFENVELHQHVHANIAAPILAKLRPWLIVFSVIILCILLMNATTLYFLVNKIWTPPPL
jgi:hypothetical protein